VTGRGRIERGATPSLLLLAFAACDPTLRLSVQVVDNVQAPVAAANVLLSCPRDARMTVTRSGVTGSDGRFEFEGVGCMPRTCVVQVDPGGARAVLGDACRSTSRGCAADTCTEATLVLVQSK
jgi:hypothetical protein